MFGAVVQSFYEDLVGMRPLEPGYATIEFRPEMPKKLDHAEASYESVRGRVASAWRREADGTYVVDVTVPAGATGKVHVPATDPAAVAEDGSGRLVLAEHATGVRLIGRQDGRVVYRVGSGSYRFRTGVRAPGVSRTCVSRRRFRMHVTLRKGERVRSARLLIDGRRGARVKVARRRLTALVDLRGRPRRTVRVTIIARTRTRRPRIFGRTYRTCRATRESRPRHQVLRLTQR
jgi:hypothetical protein